MFQKHHEKIEKEEDIELAYSELNREATERHMDDEEERETFIRKNIA